LSAAYAKRDDAFSELISPHRMHETRCQNSTGGANRMTMGNGAALNIDDVVGELKLLADGEWHSSESLVDFDAIYIADLPTCSVKSNSHGWYGPESE
jgi:hypothetical protein